MDVMVGRVAGDSFILEPGSANRRASLTSVAAHTLYEREDPIIHEGPGYRLDLSDCNFATVGDRQVQVTGSRYHKSDDYWLKLEGARSMGFRTISIGGVRCPIMVSRIDAILDAAKQRLRNYFTGQDFDVTFHVYGRDGVMKGMESRRGAPAHELGVVMEIMAPRQDLAHAICHKLSSDLLHAHFEGQKNTSGNLAFLYSPSDVDVGEAYAFSAYHLMKVRSATEFFPINYEIAK
jgi:hypothetical protein